MSGHTAVSGAEREFWRRILADAVNSSDSEISHTAISHAPNPPVHTGIHRLPEGLLVNIFLLVADNSYDEVESVMALSQVCHQWRVILSNSVPTAWSSIQFRAPGTIGLLRLVELWLIRTGTTCPLGLKIRIDPENTKPASSRQFIDFITSYVHRWRTLDIDARSLSGFEQFSSLPTPRILANTSIRIPAAARHGYERFWETICSSVELRRIALWHRVPQHLPWSKLVEVMIVTAEGDTLIPLISNLPELIHMTSLDITTDSNIDKRPDYSHAHLPSLRTLTLSGPCITTLLDLIVAPTLHHLRIEPGIESPGHPRALAVLPQFVINSGCTLINLDLLYCEEAESLLHMFLQQAEKHLRSLERLNVSIPRISDGFVRTLTIPDDTPDSSASESTMCFPRLQILSVGLWQPTVGGLLGKMVESRFRHGSLRVALFSVAHEAAHDEDIVMFTRLEEEDREISWYIL